MTSDPASPPESQYPRQGTNTGERVEKGQLLSPLSLLRWENETKSSEEETGRDMQEDMQDSRAALCCDSSCHSPFAGRVQLKARFNGPSCVRLTRRKRAGLGDVPQENERHTLVPTIVGLYTQEINEPSRG